MSDPQTNDAAADLVVTPRGRSIWRNLSLAWLVPIAALVVTLAVAWKSYSDRGFWIDVTFENAGGIVAGESTLKYRDVVVGVVEEVRFGEDLASVHLGIRVNRDIADALPEDAEFWIVRPEVSAAGVTGLTTVLSGVYLEVSFDPAPGARATEFIGLKEAPLVLHGAEGMQITLRAEDASKLSAGAPIFHKGIEVGRIEAPQLMPEINGVVFDAFIEAPYDDLLTSASRFWVTSGLSLNLSTGGLDLSVGSLANLVRGGVSFDTVFSGGGVVAQGAVFDLFPGEEEARSSVFTTAIEDAVTLAIEFDESVRGLSAGSPVTFRGVHIGAVSSLRAFIDDADGETNVRLRVTISIDPRRLGLDSDTSDTEVTEFLAAAVEGGLRARLGLQSLFSQSLVIELVDIPDADPARLVRSPEGPPLLPSVASDLPDASATAEGLLNRVDNLPVEELIDQIVATLAAIESFAGDEDLRAAPDALVGLLTDARSIVGSESAQALPQALGDVVTQLGTITAALEQAEAAAKLANALDAIEEVAAASSSVTGTLDTTAAELNALLSDLRGVTAKANALDLEAFLVSAGDVLDAAQALIASTDESDLPGALTAALDEARAAISELRAGGLVEGATGAITSAREAADAIALAAENLPEVSARLERLVAEAERTVAGFGANSEFGRETLSSLREVREAAEALSKLARALERDPNSILFGR